MAEVDGVSQNKICPIGCFMIGCKYGKSHMFCKVSWQ